MPKHIYYKRTSRRDGQIVAKMTVRRETKTMLICDWGDEKNDNPIRFNKKTGTEVGCDVWKSPRRIIEFDEYKKIKITIYERNVRTLGASLVEATKAMDNIKSQLEYTGIQLLAIKEAKQ